MWAFFAGVFGRASILVRLDELVNGAHFRHHSTDTARPTSAYGVNRLGPPGVMFGSAVALFGS